MSMDELRMACLDIGGTCIKSALVGKGGVLIGPSLSSDPVDSGGSAERITSAFLGAARRLMEYGQESHVPIGGIGVSIGGPFDYEQGICKIKGLDKYEAIYGLNVKDLFRDGLHLASGFPILFDIDSWSFARGEVIAGAGRPYGRVIVLTLGTGVGSAFAVDGRVVSEGPGVPWLGWISGQRYREGILNDYISRTHMVRRYKELTGSAIDIKEMADKADAGDANAAKVFEEMGEELGGFLRDHNLKEFGAECLVLGGQISKSCHLFINALKKELKGIESLEAIIPAADFERSALKGIGILLFENIVKRGLEN